VPSTRHAALLTSARHGRAKFECCAMSDWNSASAFMSGHHHRRQRYLRRRVNIAARSKASRSRRHLHSPTTRNGRSSKVDIAFDDIGPQRLKNIAERCAALRIDAKLTSPATQTKASLLRRKISCRVAAPCSGRPAGDRGFVEAPGGLSAACGRLGLRGRRSGVRVNSATHARIGSAIFFSRCGPMSSKRYRLCLGPAVARRRDADAPDSAMLRAARRYCAVAEDIVVVDDDVADNECRCGIPVLTSCATFEFARPCRAESQQRSVPRRRHWQTPPACRRRWS